MIRTIINMDEIPDDLPPGTYCTRLESITWDEMKVRFLNQVHVRGDCLVQLVKSETEVTTDVTTGVVPSS